MTACKKNSFTVTERLDVNGKSFVKFGLFNLSSNTQVYPFTQNISIFANNEKISPGLGIFSTTTGYGYPGGGYNIGGSVNADYLALAPGANTFDFKVLVPNLNTVYREIYNVTQNIEVDKKYTMYLSDSTDVKSLLAPDNASFNIDSGYVSVRFVNLIPNSTSLDLYKNDSLIISNVNYNKYSDYVLIPAALADTFAIRTTGTSGGYANTATAYYRLAINTNKRIISVIAKGYLGITAAPRTPGVSVLLNK